MLSAGCHSGYNIVDNAAVPNQTNPNDWAQRMAQQQAVLIGGTGYQYGDTDFLEYSERLYLDIARRLREGTRPATTAPVAVGRALTLAKQDYLASLVSLDGIDQKAVLQATLYGLPMTGFDAPGPRQAGRRRVGRRPERDHDRRRRSARPQCCRLRGGHAHDPRHQGTDRPCGPAQQAELAQR